jgi:proteasome lid subunit RPN8/RPN11
VIEIGSGVAAATLDILRCCGAGERECVAYWVGDWEGTRVKRAVHPRHTAWWSGYEVEGAWLHAFFGELAGQHERVVAQVHTHPGDWVAMSDTDDRHVLLPSADFISVVIPRFGSGDGETWGIWSLGRDGEWHDAHEELVWTTA